MGQTITCNCTNTNHTHNNHFLVYCHWSNFSAPGWSGIYGMEKFEDSVECQSRIGSPQCNPGPANCYYQRFGLDTNNGEIQMITTSPDLSEGVTYHVIVWPGAYNVCVNAMGSTAFKCSILVISVDTPGSDLTPLFLFGAIFAFIIIFAALGFIRWKEYYHDREDSSHRMDKESPSLMPTDSHVKTRKKGWFGDSEDDEGKMAQVYAESSDSSDEGEGKKKGKKERFVGGRKGNEELGAEQEELLIGYGKIDEEE